MWSAERVQSVKCPAVTMAEELPPTPTVVPVVEPRIFAIQLVCWLIESSLREAAAVRMDTVKLTGAAEATLSVSVEASAPVRP